MMREDKNIRGGDTPRNRDTNVSRNNDLELLDDLGDYKVHHDDPDIRGWEVEDSSGRTIGEVDGLYCSVAEKRVRYIDVEVDNDLIEDDHISYSSGVRDSNHEYFDEDGENHIIIPVGQVRLDGDDNVVRVSNLTPDRFSRTKTYRRGTNIEPEYEEHIVAIFVDEDDTPTSRRRRDDQDFYDNDSFNDDRFIGRDRDSKLGRNKGFNKDRDLDKERLDRNKR